MLATGGLLGLLLMGAAVGGLVTGMDDDRADADDDFGPDDGLGREDETSAFDDGPPVALADWLAGIGEQDMAPSARDMGEDGLPPALFGRAALFDDEEDEDDDGPLFALMQTPLTGAEVPDGSHTAFDAAMPDEPPFAADAGTETGPHLDVVETIAFGHGPDIPLVTYFDAATDRLILDFPGSASDAPVIGVDLELSPGDALVLADGVPVTMVAGAAALSPAQIDIVMTGPAEPAEADLPAEGGSTIGSYEALAVIKDFNPTTQQIEIDYDPAVFAEPEVAIQEAEDGSGAEILLNGEVILSVADVTGLDPELVVLRPV